MKRMHGRGGVYKGGVFLISGQRIKQQQKITKIKYKEGLRWPPFDILHAITNQKRAGVMEGGWDRPRDRARMLGEHDGNNEPLAEGNDNDDNKYDEDGNIATANDEYAIGVDGLERPLDEGDNKYDTLSATPMQECPESQRPSVP